MYYSHTEMSVSKPVMTTVKVIVFFKETVRLETRTGLLVQTWEFSLSSFNFQVTSVWCWILSKSSSICCSCILVYFLSCNHSFITNHICPSVCTLHYLNQVSIKLTCSRALIGLHRSSLLSLTLLSAGFTAFCLYEVSTRFNVMV